VLDVSAATEIEIIDLAYTDLPSLTGLFVSKFVHNDSRKRGPANQKSGNEYHIMGDTMRLVKSYGRQKTVHSTVWIFVRLVDNRAPNCWSVPCVGVLASQSESSTTNIRVGRSTNSQKKRFEHNYDYSLSEA